MKEHVSPTSVVELDNLLNSTITSLFEEDLDSILEDEEDDSSKGKDTRSAKNAFELQRQLRSEANRLSKPKTKYQLIRKDFCTAFDTVCSKYFSTARAEKPLGEIYFFNERRKIKNRMGPRIVKNLERALCDPFLHTRDDKMKLDNRESILHTLPDICITYKLFSQQGTVNESNMRFTCPTLQCNVQRSLTAIRQYDKYCGLDGFFSFGEGGSARFISKIGTRSTISSVGK